MLVALAVAVGGAGLLRLLGRLWMRRTASGGGTAAYLASRRLGRRQDVANLMVPLLLSAAVLTFAASTTATTDAWRVARADAEVGAAAPTSRRPHPAGCCRSPARSTPTAGTSRPPPRTPSATT